MCLFMEEESLCLTCAATQVMSTHGRINAKNKVYVFIRKMACKHHRALYSVKADIQHIMNIVKTTLFLIVYTRVVPESRRLLLKHETVYQEFYEICMIFLYTSHKHFAQIWVEPQFI